KKTIEVNVCVIDVPVIRKVFRARRQIIKPDSTQCSQAALWIISGCTAPRDHFSPIVETSIQAGVHIGFVQLLIDMKLEVRPPIPVDEEDRILSGIDAQ